MSRKIDLTGMVFNNWKVLHFVGNRRYNCECLICKNTSLVLNYHLVSGASTKCRQCNGTSPKPLEVGKKYGKLTILNCFIKNGNTYCNVECDCGNINEISVSSIINQKVSMCYSCGKTYASKGYKDISGSYWQCLKRGAHTRKIQFNITLEYIWDLYEKQNKQCALTGLPIKFQKTYYKKHFNKLQTASIDRIDNNIGYIEGNCQLIYKQVNFMKHRHLQEDFILIANMIAKQHPRNFDLNNFHFMNGCMT